MALQLISPVARIIIGTIIIILAVYGYRFYMDSGKRETSIASSSPKLELSEKSPVISTSEMQSKDKNREIIKAEKPGQSEFHVLRVEEDGSVTIAGSAFANSLVEIVLDGKTIAFATAANNGDFAIVFDKPLKSGSHELYIRSTNGEGTSILSTEVGIVNIPEQGSKQGNEVIAMVTRPGEASRVTQIPKTALGHDTGEKDQFQSQLTKMDQKNSETDNGKKMKQAMTKPILLKVMEIEGPGLFVAGTGEPGHSVNLYVDNRFIGKTIVDSRDAFLLEKDLKLESGNHTIRVDMLAKDGMNVIARAETPFLHSVPPDAEASNRPGGSIRAGSSVIIRKGDNLWHLSQRILGHGIKYITIYNANRGQIRNPDLIFPGQIFRIPKVKEQRMENN